METTFSYSLRKYLDFEFEEINRAVILEDGISLTTIPKPFATIAYLGSTEEIISAGRISFEENHRYQLGIFARSLGERTSMHKRLKEILQDPEGLPIYDLATGLQTDGRFIIDIISYTPMTAEDNSNETFKHHGYFTVAIEILRDYGSDIFTQ